MTDLTWILSSCALILAVIALRAAFGKRMRPGLRYALWGLVLLRLLYPGTVLSSPVSVQGVAEQSEVVRNFEVLRGVDTIEYMDIDSSENSGYIVCPKREGMSLEWGTPERFERMQTTLKVRDVLEPIWFAGIAITSIVFLVSNLRFYAQLRKRRKPLETDCPLRVYSVENLSSSCLFGNSIYVAAETAADEAKLRHVLAHELSHHQHGDHVWALLRCVALALHWYNPLVWWAAALSRQDSELCADAGALKRLGEAERESYGATLIELSARRAPKASLLCTATTMTNGKQSLKERVTMIACRPRMTAAVVIAVVAIAVVAAGCSFAGTAERQNEATTDETMHFDAAHTLDDGNEAARALFAALGDADPAELMLTYAPVDGGTPPQARAGASILAEEYLRLFADIRWSEASPKEATDAYLRLEGSGWRLTSYLQTNACVCFEAEGQTLWFVAAEIPEDAYGRTLRHKGDDYRSALFDWYDSALAAEANHGNGTPLTADELFAWREELASSYTEGDTTYPTPVSCFFTSFYDDSRDLDLVEFLAYCPLGEPVEDEAEFDALNLDWEIEGGVRQRMTLDQMPSPTWRYRVPRINEVLMQYAGITLDDMSTDWRAAALYVPEYDAFYNFTSDFGPGVFQPDYGERNGDTVMLYCRSGEGYRVLTLRYMPDGGYHILSHLSNGLA